MILKQYPGFIIVPRGNILILKKYMSHIMRKSSGLALREALGFVFLNPSLIKQLLNLLTKRERKNLLMYSI